MPLSIIKASNSQIHISSNLPTCQLTKNERCKATNPTPSLQKSLLAFLRLSLRLREQRQPERLLQQQRLPVREELLQPQHVRYAHQQ